MENQKSNFIWNTLGNTANAVLQLILLIVVNWFIGKSDGGIFSFAFSNAYIFFTIGAFSVRAYQVTDVAGEHRAEHYVAFRYVTCALMILTIIPAAILVAKNVYEFEIIVLVGLLKGVDALSDVFQGSLQIKGRLDIAGKAVFFRTMSSAVFFTVSVIFSNDLLLACLFAFLINLVVFFLYDLQQAKRFDNVRPIFDLKLIRPIFFACLPILLSDLLSRYIYNAPKYTIQSLMSTVAQNIFSIISMPAYTINLIGLFLFYPILLDFAKKYQNNQKRDFVKVIYKLIGILLAFTLLSEVAAFFVGIPILNIMYNVSLEPYKTDLLILMLSGGLGACANVLVYVLTIIRRQKYLLFGNGLTAAAAVFLSFHYVKFQGIHGASTANLLIMCVLFLVLSLVSGLIIKYDWRKTEVET